MLKLICSLDATKEGTHLEREVQAGNSFDVALIAEHADPQTKSTTFDTAILEILYNDQDFVLFTDARSHPIAGDVVHSKSADAFNREAIRPGKLSDRGSPYSNGSLLTLRPATGDPYGPYKTATGRAGITAQGQPFEVSAGKPITIMAGKMFALAESAGGVSNVVISGHIFSGNRPVAIDPVVSTVKVTPRPNRKAFDT